MNVQAAALVERALRRRSAAIAAGFVRGIIPQRMSCKDRNRHCERSEALQFAAPGSAMAVSAKIAA
ncbi:MAG: hypothetical protein QM661_03580 [Solimonas sp.]